MSETLTYGSVRGVPGDRHPYRDLISWPHQTTALQSPKSGRTDLAPESN